MHVEHSGLEIGIIVAAAYCLYLALMSKLFTM